MTPQELKNSILQLAIQGKLVEQRPEEGTAEELYKQIQAEKQALIKAGKLKKEKPLPEITEDEIPFEIPESWKWVRIASIVMLNPKNELPDELDTAFIPMPCVSDGYRNEHTYEIQKWGSIKKGFTHFADKDIGIAKITPCFQNRKSVIFKDLPNGHGAGTTELSIVRVIEDSLSREFLLWFFKSEYFISNGKKSFTGTAGQQRIHKDYLATCVFSLPPLAEQKRIVAKIDELLPLIDRYEAAWSRLEDFNKRFPGDMQKSILQMAIQGKLVEQRPEEGTGEELLKKYLSEKEAIDKTGIFKGRKKKTFQPVDYSIVPYELPDNWIWVRLGNLVEIFGRIGFRGYTKQDIVEKGLGAITISPSNIDSSGKTQFDECTYISWEKYEESPEIKIYDGDIILVKTGSSYGKCGIVRCLPEKATINPQLAVLKYILCDVEYLDIVLKSPLARTQFEQFVIGTSIPTFSQEKLSNMLIPLPPLAEQKRIVARLEELLPLCEKLK